MALANGAKRVNNISFQLFELRVVGARERRFAKSLVVVQSWRKVRMVKNDVVGLVSDKLQSRDDRSEFGHHFWVVNLQAAE